MKFLVVDTNVVGTELRLSSAKWQLILRASRELGFRLVVPAVVLDEVKELYRRRYSERQAGYEKNRRLLEQLLGTEQNWAALPSVETAAFGYENYLASLFSRYGVIVPDYPSVEHREVVIRAGRRKAPLKESDKGYKDYLVWKTVTEFVETKREPIVFLSLNSRDFFEGENLHPDLKGDLSGQSQEQLIRGYSSLEAFLAIEIEPHLEAQDKFKEALEADQVSWLGLSKLVENDAEALIGEEYPGEDFDLRAGKVQISEIEEPESIKIEDVSRIDDRFSRIIVSYEVPVIVEGWFLVDDPGRRFPPEDLETGIGSIYRETELIVDLENQEIADEYELSRG